MVTLEDVARDILSTRWFVNKADYEEGVRETANELRAAYERGLEAAAAKFDSDSWLELIKAKTVPNTVLKPITIAAAIRALKHREE